MPLELNGFRIHVQCDGKELRQYQVKQVDGKTMRCYVPSEAGKKYEVHCRLIHPSRSKLKAAFLMYLHTDGKRIAVKGKMAEDPMNVSAVRVDSHTRRNLVFSAVRTAESDDFGIKDINLAKLGLIEARMHYAHVTGTTRAPHHVYAHNADLDQTVNEQSKKVGFNVTSFGESLPAKDCNLRATVEKVHEDADAVFQFYHQPLEHLVAAGVAPKLHLGTLTSKTARKRPGSDEAEVDVTRKRQKLAHPTKAELLDVDDLDTGSDDEDPEALEAEIKADELEAKRLEVEAALQRKKAKLARISKGRRSGSADKTYGGGPFGIKTEEKPIAVPISGETIDLTLDE